MAEHDVCSVTLTIRQESLFETIEDIVMSCFCSDLNKEKTCICTFIPVYNHLHNVLRN